MKSQTTYTERSNVIHRMYTNHYPFHYKENAKFLLVVLILLKNTTNGQQICISLLLRLGPKVELYNDRQKTNTYIEYCKYHATIFYAVPSQLQYL